MSKLDNILLKLDDSSNRGGFYIFESKGKEIKIPKDIENAELSIKKVPNKKPEDLINHNGKKIDTNDKITLNGAQVGSLVQVVQAVADGSLPRNSGLQIIMKAFGLDKGEAEEIFSDVKGSIPKEDLAEPEDIDIADEPEETFVDADGDERPKLKVDHIDYDDDDEDTEDMDNEAEKLPDIDFLLDMRSGKEKSRETIRFSDKLKKLANESLSSQIKGINDLFLKKNPDHEVLFLNPGQIFSFLGEDVYESSFKVTKSGIVSIGKSKKRPDLGISSMSEDVIIESLLKSDSILEKKSLLKKYLMS